MAGRREPETEYSTEEKSIEEIRNLRKEKMEARKKAERKSKAKEIALSLIFVFICVGTVFGISAAVKRPDSVPASKESKESASMSSVEKSTEEDSKDTAEVTEKETELETTAEVPTETVPTETVPEETVTEIASSEPVEKPPLETAEAVVTLPTDPVIDNPNVQGDVYIPSWITQDFLNISEYNRPGIQLPEVKNIVVHYVGNPGSTAKDNRDFFEDLATTHERSASSHFIVGLQGEILQCVPLWEVAYANYPRNFDTISIEVCHPDETGKYSDTTYWSVIMLASYLLEQYNLTSDDLIRHYDCNGKFCPLYYVEHPDAWQKLRDDVKYYMAAHPDMRHESP